RREALMAAFDPDRKGNKLQIINDLVTVQRITEPDRNLARKHSKNGAPTWNYYFSYVTPAQRATSLGAGHVTEVKYVFNGPGRKERHEKRDPDRRRRRRGPAAGRRPDRRPARARNAAAGRRARPSRRSAAGAGRPDHQDQVRPGAGRRRQWRQCLSRHPLRGP